MRRFASLVAVALLLAGCVPPVETDQARLCRMALPALAAPDAKLSVSRQSEDSDGKGLRVAYSENGVAHFASCRFRAPGRPLRSRDLVELSKDGAALGEIRLYFLQRFWLETPDSKASDPAPLGDLASLPEIPRPAAYLLQQAINGLPLTAVYALLAAAYSLVYGLVGRINLAFGDLAAVGGYSAAFGASLLIGAPPAMILIVGAIHAAFVAATWGSASSRWTFEPMHRAPGQLVLVASIGLSLFIQEFLRLSQGPRLNWVSPILNTPFGIARAGDFIVATAPNAWGAAAFALGAAVALIRLMARTRFGREWRAYADDPLGAQLMGVSPRATFARTFALASGLAGLAGFVMTMFYGAVGYGASTTLGLKALVAAILGGVGSIPGAFLGGLLVGIFEAVWSTAFPIDYRDVAVFALLTITLILRPGGILGGR